MQDVIDRNVGSYLVRHMGPICTLGYSGVAKSGGKNRRPQLCGNANQDSGGVRTQEGEGVRCRPTSWSSKFSHHTLSSRRDDAMYVDVHGSMGLSLVIQAS